MTLFLWELSATFFPTDWSSSCECSTEFYCETNLFANRLVFQLLSVPADAENRVAHFFNINTSTRRIMDIF